MLSRTVDAIADMVHPYRRQAASWAMGGTLLAGGTAPLAAARIGYAAAVPYVLVAALTATLAVGCRQAWRWALAVTGAALGAQIVDVIGATWAVIVSPDGGFKADDLRHLGINPRLGFAVKLLYSSLAVALFTVIVFRSSARRDKPHLPGSAAGLILRRAGSGNETQRSRQAQRSGSEAHARGELSKSCATH